MADQTTSDAPAPMGAAVRAGLGWSLLNVLVTQGATTAIVVLLSHHLPPSVYGVFGLALIFVDTFTQQLRSAAVDTLVQKQDLSAQALSTAFYVLMGICLPFFALSFVVAEPLARHFKDPSLAQVLPAFASALLFVPATAIVEAKVMQGLQFKALAIRNMIAALSAGAIGIAVAFSAFSHWALVAQRLSILIIGLLAMLVFAPWRPHRLFDLSRARAFTITATQLWVGQFMAVAQSRLGDMMVGANFGSQTLGWRSMASRISDTLQTPIMSPLMSMWVPILSKVRDDQQQRVHFYLEMSRLVALLCLPAYAGLALIGPHLAHWLLGAEFATSGDYLQVMALIGLTFPLGYFRTPILAAMGRSGLNLVFTLGELALVAGVAYVAIGYGMMVFLWAWLVPATIVGLIGARVLSHILGCKMRQLLGIIAPAYLATACMACFVIAFERFGPVLPDYAMVFAAAALGAIVYVSVLLLVFNRWTMNAIGFLRDRK